MGLDRALGKTGRSSIGIVAAGKAWADTREALHLLGIDDAKAAALGIALFKPAMVWPLAPEPIKAFAQGLDRIVVVEEKRPLIEPQLRDILYDAPPAARPRIVGKSDEDGEPLIPLSGVITPLAVARALARQIGAENLKPRIALSPKTEDAALPVPSLRRPPHFCSGCPHNTSTRVPEGHRALAGIGCHTLALWSDPNTQTLTQMGGEGASWIGQAPFTDTPHVFTNMGDGTYYHSGFLAVRAAVSAGVNITFKILYNDAVAMTGGQKVEGGLSVPAIARELAAEGVARTVVVAEEPGHYPGSDPFPDGVTVMGRDGFDCAQLELAATPGVTVLIFDQTCAAEKRRRRNRGTMEDPARWVFINERVCEGCGDCQQASHCLSVVPVATPFGEKRRIDLGSCNKDESCLNGFCPALVTVEGGRLRRKSSAQHREERDIPPQLQSPPDPSLPDLDEPWRILVAGIGGTGVVTVGHLIAMAAHIEGRTARVMDQTGLAQKGGSVMSHVTLARDEDAIGSARIAAGQANALIGCDLVVAADTPQLEAMEQGRARAVVNAAETITGAFLRDPSRIFPSDALTAALTTRLGAEALTFADAGALTPRLTGSSMAANVFLLGLAWQQGLVPVSAEALGKAIAANGVAVDANRQAFLWGRRAAIDADAVARCAGLDPEDQGTAEDQPSLVEIRWRFLSSYGGPAFALHYRDMVAEMDRIAKNRVPGRDGLADAVAEGYFRVLAAKDEYEVARLFTDGVFDRVLNETFEGDFRVHYHMAPPALAKRDKITGRLLKRRFGPWLKPLLRLLGALRFIRRTPLDLFRGSPDRKLERTEREAYEQDLTLICRTLSADTFDLCLELARLPLMSKGFGHVKRANWEKTETRRRELRAVLEDSGQTPLAAE